MRIPCPTCDRLGRVPKALPEGTAMMYCGPNGERWPMEMCQTCCGEGWIEDGKPAATSEDIAAAVIDRARKP